MKFKGKEVDAFYYSRGGQSNAHLVCQFLKDHDCKIVKMEWINTGDDSFYYIEFETGNAYFNIVPGQWAIFTNEVWPVILEDGDFLSLFDYVKEFGNEAE